jgi:hypothetical protein
LEDGPEKGDDLRGWLISNMAVMALSDSSLGALIAHTGATAQT